MVKGNGRPDLVLAVDLGGTKTTVGLVDRTGAVRGDSQTSPTPAKQGPEAVLDTVARIAAPLIASAPGSVIGVGVGAAGVIDSARGVVVSSTDAFRNWPGTDIRRGLAHRLGLPVVVTNDVTAHATGESWRGAGRGAAVMLMITVGTGVGAGIAIDGRVLTGRHHMSGEIGHAPVRGADSLRCGCGRYGHLEAIACGPALVRYHRSLGGPPRSDARAVVTDAERGDPLAARAVVDAARALGTALAAAATTLDPDVIVLGGGLSGAGPLWWDCVETTLRAELVSPLTDVPLRPSALGADAALIGAARLAWNDVADTTSEDPIARFLGEAR